jgi:hypothetical protein
VAMIRMGGSIQEFSPFHADGQDGEELSPGSFPNTSISRESQPLARSLTCTSRVQTPSPAFGCANVHVGGQALPERLAPHPRAGGPSPP